MTKLYILCGIPFSGKTTLAKEISKKQNSVRIDLDEIKFEMYGDEIKDSDLEQKDWNNIYQEMYKRIEKLLSSGKSVVHDTGNFTKHERGLIQNIAKKLAIPFVTINVNTPKKVAHQRVLENRTSKKRFDVTDSDFENTVNEMEIPGGDENCLIYDYNENPDEWIATNL